MFTYNGDSVSSRLEKGEKYEVVYPPYRTVGMVTVESERTGDRIEVPNKEWQVYQQLDLLNEVQA